MTVIAAACCSGVVWMASDSESVDDDGRPWPNARKIITIPGDASPAGLLGHTGPAADHHRVRQRLAGPGGAVTADDPDDWADELANRVDRWAREEPSLDEEGRIDSVWLLGRLGRLWLVRPGYATPLGSYNAIGSGGDLALGCLHALLGDAGPGNEDQARAAVTVAVKAALRFDDSCRGEVVVRRHPAGAG